MCSYRNCYFQHCKPAVDEDTFQKMVERQYEILKKERTKGQDDLKSKPEENGIQESGPHIHENGTVHNKPEVSLSRYH